MQTLQEMTDSEFREVFKQTLHGNKKLQRAEAPTEPIDSALPSDPAKERRKGFKRKCGGPPTSE